jgi:hypothetical protein
VTWKDAFSPDDWQQVRIAPWVVAIAVMAADPNGAAGTEREVEELRRLVADTDAHASSNDLIRAVADDLTADRTSDGPIPAGWADGFASLRDRAVEHVRSVVAVLDEVAEPGEAQQFQAWLMDLASGVAAAAKEGGFLGLGGTRVSEAEVSVLDELADVLGVER